VMNEEEVDPPTYFQATGVHPDRKRLERCENIGDDNDDHQHHIPPEVVGNVAEVDSIQVTYQFTNPVCTQSTSIQVEYQQQLPQIQADIQADEERRNNALPGIQNVEINNNNVRTYNTSCRCEGHTKVICMVVIALIIIVIVVLDTTV